jgi:hypothetical protein
MRCALKPAASRIDAIARYRKHTEGAGFFGVCASLQTFIGATASLATLKGQRRYRPTLTHQRKPEPPGRHHPFGEGHRRPDKFT